MRKELYERHYSGETLKSIGESIGVTASTVRGRIDRYLRNIRYDSVITKETLICPACSKKSLYKRDLTNGYDLFCIADRCKWHKYRANSQLDEVTPSETSIRLNRIDGEITVVVLGDIDLYDEWLLQVVNKV